MFKYLKTDRKKIINDEINSVVNRITEDYSDKEISEIVNSIKERSLAYLKHRREFLSNELDDNINSIKSIEQ